MNPGNLLFLVSWFPYSLADAAFEAHAQKFLRFDGEFHREFLEHFLAEAVHDHVDRILRFEAARVAVKNLVFTNLRGRGFMLDARGGVLHLDIRKRVRAISTVFALIDWVLAVMKATVGLVAKMAAGSRGPCVAVPADNAVGVPPTVLS